MNRPIKSRSIDCPFLGVAIDKIIMIYLLVHEIPRIQQLEWFKGLSTIKSGWSISFTKFHALMFHKTWKTHFGPNLSPL